MISSTVLFSFFSALLTTMLLPPVGVPAGLSAPAKHTDYLYLNHSIR
jgi:hypothetical protein